MARIHLTPDLSSMLEFANVGSSVTRQHRRGGGGRKHAIRRMAGEFQNEIEWTLRDISTSVQVGESVALIGLPDDGREEFLRLAAGTLFPDEGTVRRKEIIIPMIGVVPALDRSYTVRQNIYIVGGLLGMTPDEVESKVDLIAEQAEIEGRLDKYLGVARPIVRQKLAWSICMSVETRAYAIDQLLVVGDGEYRDHCWATLDRKRAEGVTFLVSSDTDEHLTRFCDRAIVIAQGAIIAETSVEEGIEIRNAMIPDSKRKRERARSEEEDEEDYEDL